MRTTPYENRELGRGLAERLNASEWPVAVYLPLRGISLISAPGQPFAQVLPVAQNVPVLAGVCGTDPF